MNRVTAALSLGLSTRSPEILADGRTAPAAFAPVGRPGAGCTACGPGERCDATSLVEGAADADIDGSPVAPTVPMTSTQASVVRRGPLRCRREFVSDLPRAI
jgi:hypothetical protein